MNLANLATLAAIVDRGSRRAAEAEADDGDARQSLLRGESTRTYNASGNVISTTNSPSATSRSMPWTTSCPFEGLANAAQTDGGQAHSCKRNRHGGARATARGYQNNC